MKVKMEVEVSKESHELAMALVDMVKVVKDAVKDGFQPGQDVPLVVLAAVNKLPMAIDGVDKLGAELAEDPSAFVKAFVLAGTDLVSLFTKAKEVAPTV